MALLPGDAPLPGWDLQAASAVSYGSGPKNTLTLSSREGRKLWLALQRELVTIQGQVVDRQEFPGFWTTAPPPSPPWRWPAPPPAGSASGAALRPPFPGIAGNGIRLLTNLDFLVYNHDTRLPGGVLFFQFAAGSSCAQNFDRRPGVPPLRVGTIFLTAGDRKGRPCGRKRTISRNGGRGKPSPTTWPGRFPFCVGEPPWGSRRWIAQAKKSPSSAPV